MNTCHLCDNRATEMFNNKPICEKCYNEIADMMYAAYQDRKENNSLSL